MQNFLYFIGIDVAKDKIDVWSTEKSEYQSIPNKRKHIRQALYHMDREHTLVVLENTGGYENTCIETLEKIGYKIHRANNNKVKNFISYRGIKAKTDKADAKVLAAYGEMLYKNQDSNNPLTFTCNEMLSEEEEALRELVLFSDNLKRIRVTIKNRKKSPNCKAILEHLEDVEELLGEKINEITEEVKEKAREIPEFNKRCSLLEQYKGVGFTSAVQLLVFLPELGRKINNKQLASLCGLAPHPHESGTKIGRRKTSKGCRNNIKEKLFLIALSAIRYNEQIKNFYQKKLEEGKRKMVALTACMRKILMQLNAISKKGTINF